MLVVSCKGSSSLLFLFPSKEMLMVEGQLGTREEGKGGEETEKLAKRLFEKPVTE